MIAAATITLFACMVIGALLRARWAMALLIPIFPLEQSLQASSQYFISHVSFVNISTSCVTLVALGWIIARRPHELRRVLTFAMVSSMIIFSWSAASLAWSPSAKLGPQFVGGGAPYILLAPILVCDVERLGSPLCLTLYLGTAVVTLVVSIRTSSTCQEEWASRLRGTSA